MPVQTNSVLKQFCHCFTSVACSKFRTFLFAWLHIIPASILGSIISIADIASNKPKLQAKVPALIHKYFIGGKFLFFEKQIIDK